MTANDEATLVAVLDLPARVRPLTAAAMVSLHPEPAIGIAQIRPSDGPNGVRATQGSATRRARLGNIRLELPVRQQTPQPENASEETL